MHRLRDAGNTLVVVEHDPAVMLAADRLIDMGPGPGERGGSIVFDGTPEAVKSADTLTGAYLGARKQVGMGLKRLVGDSTPRLVLEGARDHNLKDITVEFPLLHLVVRHRRLGLGQEHAGAGRAGAGAGAALRQGDRDAGRARRPARRRLARRHGVRRPEPDRQDRALQPGELRRRVRRDPQAVRRTSRWRVQRGYGAGMFSFNAGNGRCPTCGGSGFEHVEMQFLSDVYLRCPDCDGRRFRAEILDVTIERRLPATSRAA